MISAAPKPVKALKRSGRIYDDRGHRMSPSHSRKKGVRYRYYVSLPLLDGRPEEAGSISRVPAAEIEHLVADTVRHELGTEPKLAICDLIEGHVTRVEVHTAKILVELGEAGAEPKTIQVPWQKPPFKRRREVLAPTSGNRHDPRPIRAEAANVQQVSIETAQSNLDCSVLAALPSKTILLGVLDLSDMAVEAPAVVADRIRRALPYVEAERVIVAPDCGLKYLPRDVAFGKMCAMVQGALLVRNELNWERPPRS
jgi:Cobalamin-independent synthase, Catalytic domain